jgi:hypothetical protein
MFYVKITDPIQLVHPVSGKKLREEVTDDEGRQILQDGRPTTALMAPLTMASFVRESICNSQKIGKGPELIARIMRLEMAFQEDSLVEGTDRKMYAAVESKDYEVAKSIIEEMTWPMPLLARQVAPIVDAWMKAIDEQAWKERVKLAAVPADDVG